MAYLAPLLTVALFIVGVVVWRLQLVAKRRFEIAEQSLTAFYRASDGLSRLRTAILSAAELAGVEVPKDWSKEDQDRAREYNVYVARSTEAAPAFAELRTVQILAEIHIGPDAVHAMNVLFECRRKVFGAVDALHGGRPSNPEGMEPAQRQEHEDFLRSMRRLIAEHRRTDGAPDPDDQLSNRIDGAKALMGSACRPFLEDLPWLKTLSSFSARLLRR
jgi:hypothetical protein